MVRGLEGNEMSTPKPPALKKSSSSTSKSSKNQQSILGFFQKRDTSDTPGPNSSPEESVLTRKSLTPALKASKLPQKSGVNLTPVPSSDAIEPSSPVYSRDDTPQGRNKENGVGPVAHSNPSRMIKKTVNYAESESEDEEVLRSLSMNRANARPSKRRRVSLEDSDDEFGVDADMEEAMADEDLDDFVVPDDSDEEPVAPKKRKRLQQRRSSPPKASSPPPAPVSDDDFGLSTALGSTAQQWNYDPENLQRLKPRPAETFSKKSDRNFKEKAHKSEPSDRYPWLANILDADRHPPDHPDYDPRTLYVPPMAWAQFSPFEKQYWEIKQKFWDTIVFFKKGKFYELYENDATIGHQLFDLKLTDRVNMRMVGVPEASLDMWATQFVAKGFKIARVDQMESALAKEMRERDGDKPTGKKKEEKVIRRELAAVLTSGTLVDGGMLQDDMSTYCVAIKEIDRDNLPALGIAFVDTATAQFHLTEFTDDLDMTKFETFVAQTRPGELLLEKSCISAKALRILKNNTGPTTIWNYLKPEKEFWSADITCREIEVSDYFVSPDQDNIEAWPKVLREAREKELTMSAFGALLQYLRTLKIEKDLVTLGNFSWYDPIRKATSLVLDGQSLINLEIFANSFDGSTDGTLFAMLNRCITPFGKRMLRQWVCHPLADAVKINARLDAVDALNASTSTTDTFTSSLSKLPDLERLISRVHAGRCKAQDFLKVLEGFEQIEYTMSLLNTFGNGKGDGIIGQLLSSMPDLSGSLKHWRDAFDRTRAKEDGILVPQRGVEEDYDESQDTIDAVLAKLESLLKQVRRDLGSTAICFRDNGKEIYQLEIPIKVKGVPKSWDQMSATAKVKRYYSPELRKLVRALQEAQETHGQIVKEVAGRFYARFDEDYPVWLAAVKIIAQLDCLISLAKASSSLGEPSCRPTFVDDDRTVLEFEELRHPCMLTSVQDFIPNDIKLGGDSPNIDLLTGANAAGKSTILRMTCIAVILAQIGCHLPCTSARITPIDRIMSRLGANDNIFAAQSTFFVELAETKKILSEATPRSLVILDELGRGTSSYDGVAVAQAVLHHVATHVGCIGFFATHYHSLAAEFAGHPEIKNATMAIDVDEAEKRVTFLYKLIDGVAEGSFGMHCAAMCGIPSRVIRVAEVAAKEFEHTSRLKESLEMARGRSYVPLGVQSDVAWLLRGVGEEVGERGLEVLRRAVEAL
ncbi:DNA mismatch repair protein Msh6 [Patellaria atrata CBS 101060]|uniref:DNA mismatch repair protein n=1 Tax=Patellaria atrata CBS 101060 TaxID=1346257 RepID=A0A9P4S6H5_9PEZI|nr:DNA mismatch repair protein Msh6 [Patellaria atrata CBS 101060]